MKTLKFEIEYDIEGDEDFTSDQILSIASELDWSIKKMKETHGVMPVGVYRDLKLVRVKPIL